MAKHEKYEPPSDETLFEFAQQVGSNLAERLNTSFARHDIVRGLADFLATIATIEANQRNREHLFDDE
jgi:hypothetical protein